MFDVLTDLHWGGLALAAAVGIALAGLWFAVVVATPYRVALGRENGPAPDQGVVGAVGPPVCVVVVTLTSAVLIEALGLTTTGDAVAFGLIVGIGYLTAMAFQVAINPNVPRPLLYGVVNAPYFVLSSVLGAVIYTAVA